MALLGDPDSNTALIAIPAAERPQITADGGGPRRIIRFGPPPSAKIRSYFRYSELRNVIS
jgi:hypothetical protein